MSDIVAAPATPAAAPAVAAPTTEEADLSKIKDIAVVRQKILRQQLSDGIVMASRRVEQLVHGELRHLIVGHFDHQTMRVADPKKKEEGYEPAIVFELFNLHERWSGASIKLLSDPAARSVAGAKLCAFAEEQAKKRRDVIPLIVDVIDNTVGNVVLRAVSIISVAWNNTLPQNVKAENGNKRANRLISAGADIVLMQNGFSAIACAPPKPAPKKKPDADSRAGDAQAGDAAKDTNANGDGATNSDKEKKDGATVARNESDGKAADRDCDADGDDDDRDIDEEFDVADDFQRELSDALAAELSDRTIVQKNLVHKDTLRIVQEAILFNPMILTDLKKSVEQAAADKRTPCMSVLIIRTQNRRLASQPDLLSRASFEAMIEKSRSTLKPESREVYLVALEQLGKKFADSQPHDVTVLIEDCGTGPLLGTMVRVLLDHIDLLKFEKIVEKFIKQKETAN
jgi:hypothetical protein